MGPVYLDIGDKQQVIPVVQIDSEQTLQVLRAMTTWAARAAFEEYRIGSLEPGKQAELVILDLDIMTCQAEDIPRVEVFSTVIAGEEVYNRLIEPQ